MSNQSIDLITLRRRFLQPANTAHRQYEALRAFVVDGLSSRDAARRFGYSPGSFRILVHRFRQEPERPFFLPDRRAAHARQRNADRLRQIIALRKQNLSIYDISRTLAHEGQPLTPAASGLYRLLGARIGHGYQRAKSRSLFEHFVDATASVTLGGSFIDLRFQKRAHNPLLLAAGFDKTDVPVPWLGGKRLRLLFG